LSAVLGGLTDGTSGAVGKFREAGMGAQADSWVGTGENLKISLNQLEQVFGSGA